MSRVGSFGSVGVHGEGDRDCRVAPEGVGVQDGRVGRESWEGWVFLRLCPTTTLYETLELVQCDTHGVKGVGILP